VLRTERGGNYYRVADPSWRNPLDGAYAAMHGGRWTTPGSYPTVYLCQTIPVARGIVNHNFDGLPYGPEDITPDAAPLLLDVTVAPAECLDVTNPTAAEALGLPPTYPLDATGIEIRWEACQPVGQQAYDAGLAGVACLSARANGEELAHFNRASDLALARARPFAEWFWPQRPLV
jgi:RES domain-containing protein